MRAVDLPSSLVFVDAMQRCDLIAIADRQCPASIRKSSSATCRSDHRRSLIGGVLRHLPLPACADCDPSMRSWPLISQIEWMLCIWTAKPVILVFSWFWSVFCLPIVYFYSPKGFPLAMVLIGGRPLTKTWRFQQHAWIPWHEFMWVFRLWECFGSRFYPFV